MKEDLTNQLDENGKEHGPWKHVIFKNNWWFEGTYHHGVEHGHWRHFLQNEIRAEGRYHHGVKRGPWIDN
jgi:hypothetical protein